MGFIFFVPENCFTRFRPYFFNRNARLERSTRATAGIFGHGEVSRISITLENDTAS